MGKEIVGDSKNEVMEEKEEIQGNGNEKGNEETVGEVNERQAAATTPHSPSSPPLPLPCTPVRTQYVWALDLLLPKCLSPNLPKRHGAVLAVAEIILCASLAATANSTGSSLFSGIVSYRILLYSILLYHVVDITQHHGCSLCCFFMSYYFILCNCIELNYIKTSWIELYNITS